MTSLLWLRRLREDGWPALVLAALVLVTAFVFAIAPRLLDRLADDALQREIAGAPAFSRNIQLLRETRYPPGPPADPLDTATSIGRVLEDDLPPQVASLVADRGLVVDSIRFVAGVARPADTFARLRIQPGAETRIRYVAGGPPGGASEIVTRPPIPPETANVQVAQLEAALSVENAKQLDVGVGDVVDLTVDDRDPLVQIRVDPRPRLALRVTGIFEVPAPEDAWWLADRSLERVSIRALSADVLLYDTTPLLSPDAYRALLQALGDPPYTFRYTWRYYLDPTRLDADRAGGLETDLRRLDNAFPTSQITATSPDGTAMRTDLLRLVQAQRARWRSTETVLVVVGLGPAIVGATALALVTLLSTRRSRLALPIWRARGASRVQVGRAALGEALLLTLPVVALAALLAIAAVPAAPDLPTVAAAGAVAIATTAFLLALALAAADAGTQRTAPEVPARRGRARIVAEAIVVILAVAGAWLLRERGVAGASSASALGGIDPFVAAVPALVGVAAALVAVRLAPLPMRLAAALAGTARGLVPALATRRAVHGASARSVLVVLMAAATIAAFSSAVLSTLDRSADAVGWQQVGADYRVRAAADRFPSGFDPARIGPVDAAAVASLLPGIIVGRGDRIEVLAVDLPAYGRVVAGTPAAVDVPAAMLTATAAPIPVIVTRAVGARYGGYKVGDRVEAEAGGRRASFVVAAVRDRFPSVAAGDAVVVVSRTQLSAALPNPPPVGLIYLRAPASAFPGIRASANVAASGSIVDDRAAISASIQDQPAAQALVAGVAAATLIAAVFAALAVAAALGLAGASRALETALLRTLGLTRREAVGLVVVEHLPIVALGFVAGAALGIGLFALLRDGLRLDAVVGAVVDVPITIEPAALALVLAGVAVIAVLGIALGAILQSRAAAAAAVRRGSE